MFDKITDYIEEISDHRMKEKFLMSSPLPTCIFVLIYLVFVKLILPAFMKNRPAFNMKKSIYYYNIIQVILSAYIVYLAGVSGFVRRFPVWQCRDMDRSESDPDALMAMKSVYVYFLVKFTEFLDTVFFILRKKSKQVSFLHLYHHASMPLNVWLMAKLVPGGTMCMSVLVNSFVHVVMYTYYLLSGLGPRWQKYLWWKKYLTAFQLVQFAFGLYQLSLVMFGDCPILQVYRPLIVYYLLYVFTLLLLFGKFYRDSYSKELSKKDINMNGVAKPLKIN